MIPAAFDYVRATSIEHAFDLLASDEDAKLLAGGHSLVPLMKLRLATPSQLVDIGRLTTLRYVEDRGDYLAIGALATHRMLQTDPVVRLRAPLLATVAAEVGDPQVRHRGTIGGSVSHGDPASDLPAALLALGARFVVTGSAGERIVDAGDFHLGFLETALEPAEILTEIQVPAGRVRCAFAKFRARSIDWAVVGVAAVDTPAGVRVVLANMGATPLRALAVEEALAGGATAAEAAERAAEGSAPPGDLAATPAFRCHLARVLTARTLGELEAQRLRTGAGM
ncbi:MAG TPA: FAD binding domain-containing protein [Streptosporangiaceae bacterium]|nr:FAD binding domain-containing protein [Streptosporangiaceae bacterium]